MKHPKAGVFLAKNALRALAVGASAVGLILTLAGPASAQQRVWTWSGNRIAIDNSPGTGASWAWVNDEMADQRGVCLLLNFQKVNDIAICDGNGAHNEATSESYSENVFGDVVEFRACEYVGDTWTSCSSWTSV
ncbi:hypothetical protein [Streptomyces sp. NBC_00887]|uniref:hypothetical protein n=1 Tax=Streptomyces sp. NBC_00887 TaxID=2975859 RepID=UPI003864625A|nr:hypothetical protein OG844_00270 [Streptomyces sp. NBC_00887]WSY36359.1 hypothetical protein OG844_45330 [Streptomyces sp. NBC_00887]